MTIRFFAALIACVQWFGLTVGIIPYSTDVDYGGTRRVEQSVTQWLTLADGGETEWVIVTPSTPAQVEATAASELQKYLFKICGAEFDIISDSAPATSKEIAVGATNRRQLDFSALGNEGFILKADGDSVFICGASPRATLYAVYAFLEEQLGCRYFTPKDERIPSVDTLRINALLNDAQKPDLAVRRNAPQGVNAYYYAKSRTNVVYGTRDNSFGDVMSFIYWDVTLTKLVPDSLFAEHPDYFAYLSNSGRRSTQHVCLSNPEVLAVAVENAKAAIQNNTTPARYLHIGQKDNTDYCECENCCALYEKYGSVSAPTILFANALSDAIKDEYPDIFITFYAYNETRNAPTDPSLRCGDKVIPVVCGSHQACKCHPYDECGQEDTVDFSFIDRFTPSVPTYYENLKAWKKISNDVFIYEYTINFLNGPQFMANFATLQPDFALYRDIGVGVCYTCGDGHYAALNELRNYLISKIEWDCDCDVEYHMLDFLSYYYGEAAAPYIKEYIDLMTAKIRAVAHAFDFDWHYQIGYFNIREVNRIDELWEKALEADVSDEQLFRIEKEHLGWKYYKANLFLDEYMPLNPMRKEAIEALYDDFAAHGIDRVSSIAGLIPPKESIDFNSRPFNWR